MEGGESIDQSTGTPAAPPQCPHVEVCDFEKDPRPAKSPQKSLDESRDHFVSKARNLSMPPQQRGLLAEARAIEHNRVDHKDGRGNLKDPNDVEGCWFCNTCKKEWEIDQVLRDDNGKVTGLVEVKSGGNLRGDQAGVHAVIASQCGVSYFKKVQHKAALKKCRDENIPHFDMSSTPELKL